MTYRDIDAEQRIADLERMLRERQDCLDEAYRDNKSLRASRLKPLLEAVFHPLWWGFMVVIVGAAVGVWKVASADGKIDYCYVSTTGATDIRALYGHRPWRENAQLKSLPAAEDPAPLFALAEKIGCPIK